MLRRIVVRLFLSCIVISSLVAGLIGYAGYLVLREPAFYSELRSQEFSSAEHKLAEIYVRQLERDFERWNANAILRQRQSAAVESPQATLVGVRQDEYDPRIDSHVVRVTQQQINALIASQKATSQGDWRNPRIRIASGCIDLAIEIVEPEVSCVLSTQVRPTIAATGQLQLDIISAHLGKLPLPLQTLWNWIPRDLDQAASDLKLDLASPKPRLRFSLGGHLTETAKVRSIECREGEIVVEFRAPILEQRDAAGGGAAVAVNGR